jgi:hypothetical protein
MAIGLEADVRPVEVNPETIELSHTSESSSWAPLASPVQSELDAEPALHWQSQWHPNLEL